MEDFDVICNSVWVGATFLYIFNYIRHLRADNAHVCLAQNTEKQSSIQVQMGIMHLLLEQILTMACQPCFYS